MKIRFCIFGVLLWVLLPARAGLYQSGTLNAGTTIPDNNTIGTGNSLTWTLSGAEPQITAVTLSFVLQGGDSSDLSGYLRLGNQTSSPFYNLTSLIQGATLNPSSGTTYTIDFSTSGFQSAFNGLNPNDTWTLFFADTSAGDQTTLNGWSLSVTAVPEPMSLALAVFGVVGVGAGLGRRYFRSRSRAV